ncbi:MAG: Threonine synthase [Chloroflexi bacterium ADurb.Bin325]|nr:MAG: Threonine synthase [Chloroflexi bacterium ADurb.Bin325]
MAFSAWYQCIRGCPGRYNVLDVIYRCPTCDGLLEVVHDTAALAAAGSAAEWRDRFAARSAIGSGHVHSGVWAKHEWVLPQVSPEHIVTLGEGYTPLLPVPRLGRDLGVGPELWVKQCGISHTGSFKDLGMTVLVSAVRQMMAQDGCPVAAVACASTGDTSAALAAYAAAAGIPALVFLPRGKITTAQLIQPIANAARVLALDTDFDGCMRIVQEVTRDNSIYLANSMNSLRVEGQKTVGIEIVQQLGWAVPDWIILPSGNLGNISALAKGLALAHALGVIDRLPRLAAAQAQRANPLYQAYRRGFDRLEPVTAGATAASAIRIGNPVSYEKAVSALRDFGGVVEQASEDELADAVALADRAGLYADPHTGVALAAARKLAAAGVIQPGQRVVVVSTAHGLKFSEFKVGYHEGALADVVARHRNPPVELPADAVAVKAEIARWLAG